MKNSKNVYEVETKTDDEIDYEHYNNGFIDLRVIPEFYVWVATNVSGETKVIDFDDNFFSAKDLLEAYLSLWKDDWAGFSGSCEDCKSAHINAFKRWLIGIGAEVEDLED